MLPGSSSTNLITFRKARKVRATPQRAETLSSHSQLEAQLQFWTNCQAFVPHAASSGETVLQYRPACPQPVGSEFTPAVCAMHLYSLPLMTAVELQMACD